MSRTIPHRPYRAWLAVPSVCVEVHDHRDGPCDLPTLAEFLHAVKDGGWPHDQCCGWDIDIRAIPPTCGCSLCTGRFERRWERRRDRHQARLALQRGDWLDDQND
jgi:hypothetical protein